MGAGEPGCGCGCGGEFEGDHQQSTGARSPAAGCRRLGGCTCAPMSGGRAQRRARAGCARGGRRAAQRGISERMCAAPPALRSARSRTCVRMPMIGRSFTSSSSSLLRSSTSARGAGSLRGKQGESVLNESHSLLRQQPLPPARLGSKSIPTLPPGWRPGPGSAPARRTPCLAASCGKRVLWRAAAAAEATLLCKGNWGLAQGAAVRQPDRPSLRWRPRGRRAAACEPSAASRACAAPRCHSARPAAQLH